MKTITLPGYPVIARPSPNYGSRAGVDVSLIVLHSTGDSPKTDSALPSVAWLCNPQSRVSAHFVVSRAGEIYQLVDLANKAAHAGVSVWQRAKVMNSVNAFSIGIEQEHVDGVEDWPAVQLAATAALCQALRELYHLPIGAIVGHCDVAPGRKVDPVAFPWNDFRARLQQDTPRLQVGGTTIRGQLITDHLYVPAREACAALGLPCLQFVPPDGLQFPGGATLYGEMIESRLYLQARELCALAHYHALWDSATNTLRASK